MSGPAAAQERVGTASPDTVKEAKTYYDVGASAYERGDFEAAIQAFLEAQRRVEKPQVVFAIAQAYRRKYYVDKAPESLQRALEHYRRYLAVDARGPRAADASQSLAELGLAEERLLADPTRGARAAVQPDRKTRLAITSTANGAEVAVDGAAYQSAPLLREVTPGKHEVVVRAPGYEEGKRSLVALEGSLVAFDITLRDKPASLFVQGERGARVEIDGRLTTTRPGSALLLAPGRHLVAVSRTGHEPYVREITFRRGETQKLQVTLRSTSRRRISNGFLVASGVTLVGAGVLGALALERQGAATELRDARSTRNLTVGDRDDYESARSARNTFAVSAGLAAGATVLLGGLGLVLHVFDDPSRNAPSLESDGQEAPPTNPVRSIELGLRPWAGPTGGGMGLGGRF